jgi:hypothetical protein
MLLPIELSLYSKMKTGSLEALLVRDLHRKVLNEAEIKLMICENALNAIVQEINHMDLASNQI